MSYELMENAHNERSPVENENNAQKRRKLDSVSKGAHKCIRAFRLNLEIRYGVDITATKIKLKKETK